MFYLLYIHLTALNTASSRKHKESSNSEWNYRITFREKYHFHGLYYNCFHRLLWGKLIRAQSVHLTADPFPTSWNQIRTKLGSKWFGGSFGSSTASRKKTKSCQVSEKHRRTRSNSPHWWFESLRLEDCIPVQRFRSSYVALWDGWEEGLHLLSELWELKNYTNKKKKNR